MHNSPVLLVQNCYTSQSGMNKELIKGETRMTEWRVSKDDGTIYGHCEICFALGQRLQEWRIKYDLDLTEECIDELIDLIDLNRKLHEEEKQE